jgi:hypothetical protein
VLECTPEEAIQVAQYLADEYFQLGDAMLVINRVTGRAVARFTDHDIWTPAPVPREDGSMAQPLPRLRPDLEGFLVSHYFDQAKDVERLARVQARYPQTLALRDGGDPRLRVITRSGRASMIDDLRTSLPGLLDATKGAAKLFLDHFEVRDTPPKGFMQLPPSVAVARSQQSIGDPLTFSLRHDGLRALAARIGTSWVREIARRVASAAEPRKPINMADLNWKTLEYADFWILPPHAYSTFSPFTDGLLPVENVEPTGLLGHVGAIEIGPEGYSVQAREVFSRWEVEATLSYTLYVDPQQIVGLQVPDLPFEPPTEIV